MGMKKDAAMAPIVVPTRKRDVIAGLIGKTEKVVG